MEIKSQFRELAVPPVKYIRDDATVSTDGDRRMPKSNRELHSLMYSSLARPNLSRKEILEIIERARGENEKHDITGLLLYHKGSFLQVLEGERREIKNLYEKKLLVDTRHSNVTLFHNEPIAQRQFRYWHLAFNDLTDPPPEISAPYREYLNETRAIQDLTNNTSKALDLVRQIHRRVLSRYQWDRNKD